MREISAKKVILISLGIVLISVGLMPLLVPIYEWYVRLVERWLGQ